MDKTKKLWTLFISMLTISSCTFGGGFVIVTLMKQKFVDKLNWIDENEMLDMTALAQSAPGSIAVNAAILVGRRVAGFPGMVTAVIGTIIPPLVILSILSFCYNAFAENRIVRLFLKGMKAGISAVIFDIVIKLGTGILKQKSVLYTAVMIIAFAVALLTDINIVIIILACMIIGIVSAMIPGKRGGAK